jgi:hypothetical protein
MTLAVSIRARRGLLIAPVLLIGHISGCMSQQLRFTTLRTLNSLPDLHYQQVVDNLAKIASNPGFLPYFAVPGQGSVQVTDNSNSALALTLSNSLLGPRTIGIGASRNVTGTWTMGTITSPEKLRSMQAVYLRALRGVNEGDPAFGWLKVGRKEEVPKQATHVGHHADSYAWVVPDGIDGLSELTLAIMDIATSDDSEVTPDSGAGRLRGMAATPGMPRRNFQVPPVGPVFTPGVH